MKDNFLQDFNIEEIVDSVSENKFVSLTALKAQLKRTMHELKSYYGKANASETRSPVDEWLCDNYYVLEKESKHSVKDIKHICKNSKKDELGRFYNYLSSVVIQTKPEICDDTIKKIVSVIGKKIAIEEKQFSFIPCALKLIFIFIAYDACVKTQNSDDIAYAIIGLNKLSSVDIEEVVKECSMVEKILLRDPAKVYEKMDLESRQNYRSLISKIAYKTDLDEQRVATEMFELAENSTDKTKRHIGYHIVNSPVIIRPRRRRGKIALYSNVLLSILISAAIIYFSGNFWVGAACFLPVWEILKTLIHQISMAGADIDFIPRMDLEKLEERPKTAVLVSTLLPKASEASALAKRLEQLYFSNSDPDMYYCILADFKEWDYPVDEKDSSQIRAAKNVINELNKKYDNRFMLFLRARTYNKTQRKYSGWERKRGAITEFIRFLKGRKTSVHTFVGDKTVKNKIKYIIALDSDTNMLYESAQTLVSAAVHPLNRPVISTQGVVIEGYGVLVPKMSTDLYSAKATAFSRVLSGCGGVTAYDTRDKDFYQDLFGESIFAGKGLIDVDCFYEILDNRFPENQILSHDILEGAYLRTGFVSDVEMTDTAPKSLNSWLARLHRWLRGDWQNIKFLCSKYKSYGKTYENPISSLSKYKIFDNLRRSLTTIISLVCIFAGIYSNNPFSACILTLVGVLSASFASWWSALWSMFTGGIFTLSRKFFTKTLPHIFELFTQGIFFLIMLPAAAVVNIDAFIRSIYRNFITRKKMLEWTTAAQSDGGKITVKSVIKKFWIAEVLGILYLIAAKTPEQNILGILFCLIIPLAYYSAKPSEETRNNLDAKSRDTLVSYNAAMWRYYEDFANEENNFLPPDNVQQSPVYRVANRTSPTNIGMMLLSVLAARDFDFIDSNGLYERIKRTLDTVDKLKTWKGNLFNWYDTQTLETLKPEFVSSVDSGNYICSLVALKEGLKEYAVEKKELWALVGQIEKIIENTDISTFYDKKRHLFTIGWDAEEQQYTKSYYDFLMSEARLTSYYAVARKLVGKKHWGALNRTMSGCDGFAGSVSWTGTMFEYFMPHLLLPIHEGSLLAEALSYCIYCHKKRVKHKDIPWGISESAFYAFDNNLNYQYKAHGVGKLGVKRYLDRELVISPYSTFITVPFNPNTAMQNLKKLHLLGLYGQYGFYEAVDFTQERVGENSLAVIRSYMAHHIGMSMVSSANAVFGGIMQKRFMRDNYMKSAEEFLQEKIAKNTVVYDEMKNTENSDEKHERPKRAEEINMIYPTAPKCMLLTNGEITDIMTDCGAGYLKFGDIDVTRRSTDILRRAHGIFGIVRMNGKSVSVTKAPFYQKDVDYSAEQTDQNVSFYAEHDDVQVGMRCMVHPTISCQQRQVVVKNNSQNKQLAQVLLYFEPVLSSYRDYSAHPAYSKLFVTASYDKNSKTITYCRRNRDSSETMFLTVGFLSDIDFEFETHRENMMRAGYGHDDLFNFSDKSFRSTDGGVPDACCAIKYEVPINAGAQHTATLLLCAATTKEESLSAIISMRKSAGTKTKSYAKSPVAVNSLEGRIAGNILGQLLFNKSCCAENRAYKQKNTLGQSGLWSVGISGDVPIALFEYNKNTDEETLKSYLKIHSSLRAVNIEFDLCFIFEGEENKNTLTELVNQHSSGGIIGQKGGIYLIDKNEISEEISVLIRSVARHTYPEIESEENIDFIPVELENTTPEKMPDDLEVKVEGGGFLNGKFYVDKTSPLPYSHILANPSFGTLVSDNALGFTWAVNSRENKLTPWYNDIATDNRGEMCVLYDGDRHFDLIRGSRAIFSQETALYKGKTSKFANEVKVSISQKGFAKYIDVTLENLTDERRLVQCAYYTEPVLAVNRDTAQNIVWEIEEQDTLALYNPYNTAVNCYAALTARGQGIEKTFICDRRAFLSGDWSENITINNDPCAAIVASANLEAGEKRRIRFVLSYGNTKESAVYMAKNEIPPEENSENKYIIDTPDKHLNVFINHFAPHQILHSRIYGRCAFYQCGGAYGFRDQLQDTSAYMLIDPEITKRQILRCCSVQFEEGDVLHWWHDLPEDAGGLKGVRTRFSDDLLWLPFVVSEYVIKTGDADILSMKAGYLKADVLGESEHEKYISPEKSELVEDVFAHCVRAIDKGYNLGDLGLPLIGCGDWNDGFSSVGLKGKGQSVWLALFISIVLEQFVKICDIRGEKELEQKYLSWSKSLKKAVDEHCWDGEWYLRAFYDNSETMGSAQNEECRIDLLPQSFSVLSKMPDVQRVETAMENAYKKLVNKKLRLVHLFDKPFQNWHQQPGYIKAYPGGIRENGGQYTHAAVWFALALIKMGEKDKGYEILQMLNPVNRTSHEATKHITKTEPYYMAADIYSNPSAAGQGGWTMYTGAASWYYRVVIEHLLGIKRRGKHILIEPNLPSHWQGANVKAEIDGTILNIEIKRGTEYSLIVDGKKKELVSLNKKSRDIAVTVS